jgi:hypothetical protein
MLIYSGDYGTVTVEIECVTYNHYRTCRENGIKYRRDEAVGGWFSQIGEMHQVHHLWGKAIIKFVKLNDDYCVHV